MPGPLRLQPALELIGVVEPRPDVPEWQAPLAGARIVIATQHRVAAVNGASSLGAQPIAHRLEMQEPALRLLDVEVHAAVVERPDPLVVLPRGARGVDLDGDVGAALDAAAAQVGILDGRELAGRA